MTIEELRKQTEEAKLEAFSLMCKKVTELEAEVKEWKDKADLWCKTANLKDHNIMINKELEKENARLKEINTHTLSQLNLDNGELIIENEKLKKENVELKAFINAPLIKGRRTTRKEFYQTIWDLSGQLTKAKEIISELLSSCFGYNAKTVNYEVKARAEQFLKEE